ncbi:hypothetical protein [Rhizobium sp. BR 315]|uniref:hypothetical protein n=1 Tax=Rhizobium sp. BR 315 TaxID=3040014 RepID=UPI003D32DE3A
MYNAKRDGYLNGASKAIPCLGAIEGRITVLEVVAMTSLGLLLEAGDRHAAVDVVIQIREAMRAKCDEIKLNPSDADSAIGYAQELVDATFDAIHALHN